MKSLDHFDVLIAGAGIAGCTAALLLAPLRVGLISPGRMGADCSSLRAQGGIAAAVDQTDSTRLHVEDTLQASGGLTNMAVVRRIISQSTAAVSFLERNSVQFDKCDGTYHLSREGGHRAARVLRAQSRDGFGRAMMPAIWKAVDCAHHITVLPDTRALDLIKNRDGRITGIKTNRGKLRAQHIILATGGAAGLYNVTTNSSSNIGSAVALAYRAGASLADLEFMQFHPTALVHPALGDETPLISEALRGHGARLCNDKNEYFMADQHPLKDLAPRDIIARAIFSEMEKGRQVYLDCRQIDISEFTTLVDSAARCGLDPKFDLLPVAPAAHYHMGGVWTDANGQTSLRNLWVIGEAASTGLHGANRLASNSLLEGIVMGRACAGNIRAMIKPAARFAGVGPAPAKKLSYIPADEKEKVMHAIRKAMTDHVGLMRDAGGLQDALEFFRDAAACYSGLDQDIEDASLAAALITQSALMRTESRGAHARSDYPFTDVSQNHRQMIGQNVIASYRNDIKQKETV